MMTDAEPEDDLGEDEDGEEEPKDGGEEEPEDGGEEEPEDDGKDERVEITLTQLIQYIAEALVDFPAKVEVNAVESETSIILELKVAPEDVGKVIGKGGQTAKAMRKVLSAAATKLRKKSLLQIIE